MHKRYPEELTFKADQLFGSGFGYKAVATMLGLPDGTVRYWQRRWAKMTPKSLRPDFARLTKEVMLESGTKYICRFDEGLLMQAYKRGQGSSDNPEYIYSRVFLDIRKSEDFKRLPMRITFADNRRCSVYKLVG